ncbi:hypothetical protein A5320_20380 [Rheinheimera sp. SA_1]|uniref:hypothetical protein n=1 Tax=Rheinheimera sp. SA_1 TaxID=1827365 RepID=UPI0008002CFB|nr:hypothetical protein [Rheinheimera sp. SA_1]OBP17212.1 hypothetical protein A5320_20380 [Rheinheimera sp. SA_1]
MQNEFVTLMVSFDNHLFFGFILLLCFSIVVYKKMSSVTTAFFALCCWQAFSIAVTPFLYQLASNEGILYKFSWYGTWIISNLFFIWMIYQFHSVQKLRASSVAIAVSTLILAISVVQAVDFIDRATTNSGLMANFYQLFIPAANIAIIPVVTYLWLYEYRKTINIAATGA